MSVVTCCAPTRSSTATAADRAYRTELHEAGWRAEFSYRTGGHRPAGTGVPARPRQITVPDRGLGYLDALPVGAEHDPSAAFAILYRHGDKTQDWLRVGDDGRRAPRLPTNEIIDW